MTNLEHNSNFDNLNERSSLNEVNENQNEVESEITEDDKKEMEKMKDNEKLRLNKIHESLLDLKFPNKINWKYESLREIINDDISEVEKLELLVKSVHEMDNKITLDLWDNKTETMSFYCWNRALFFNYLFNNQKYGSILNVEKSTICLPYGHCMNIAKIWWKNYIIDWWVWCFNEIDWKFELKKNWSWECVKLQEPIEHYKGCWTLYPFTSFPYTENLSPNDLELYTSCNLQTYSYFFTNRLYEVAQEYDKNITDRDWLKRFLNDVLEKKDNPLEWILGENDAQLKNSKATQINLIQSQLDKAWTYEENLKQFKSFENYIKTITKEYPDLMPSDEWREWILRNFNFDDIKLMDWLNIPKEDLVEIVWKLNEVVWNVGDWNIVEAYSSYILDKYENFEPILNDERLNTVLMEFLNAVKTMAGQLNKTLREFLPGYIKETLSKE